MRKYLAPAAVVAAVLTVFLAGIAVAQSGALAGLAQPVIVNIEQLVPVDVTLALPQDDGSVITTTAPLTVGVSLQIRIGGNQVVAVAPAAEAEPAEVAVATEEAAPAGEEIESVWDIPHLGGRLDQALDIEGFQLQPAVSLFDFEQVRAWDEENAEFYDRNEFRDATVLGLLSLTITNTSDIDLRLPINSGAVVVGSQQVDLPDFQYLGDSLFDQALLPGVTRSGIYVFALGGTSFSDLSEDTAVLLQLKSPIQSDSYESVSDEKYRASIQLESLP